MEEYVPALMILIAMAAIMVYIIHLRWFDRHVWPGSSREDLDRILKHNHEELVKKERDEQAKNSKLDGPTEKKNMTHVQGNLTKVMQVRALSTELQPSAHADQQSKGQHTSTIWKS